MFLCNKYYLLIKIHSAFKRLFSNGKIDSLYEVPHDLGHQKVSFSLSLGVEADNLQSYNNQQGRGSMTTVRLLAKALAPREVRLTGMRLVDKSR